MADSWVRVVRSDVALFVGGLPVGECRAPTEIDGLATRSPESKAAHVERRCGLPVAEVGHRPAQPAQGAERRDGHVPFSGLVQAHTPGGSRAFAQPWKAPARTRRWRKTDSNPRSLSEGKCWKGRTSRRGGSFFKGGLRVRIRLPPAGSLV